MSPNIRDILINSSTKEKSACPYFLLIYTSINCYRKLRKLYVCTLNNSHDRDLNLISSNNRYISKDYNFENKRSKKLWLKLAKIKTKRGVKEKPMAKHQRSTKCNYLSMLFTPRYYLFYGSEI